MQKKLFFAFAIIVSIIFSFSICFAADNPLKDATNTVRNAVDNTEDAVEGAMQNAGNATKDAMNSAGNAMQDSMDKTENTMGNVGNTIENTGNTVERDMNNATSKNNDTYTAARTSTNGNATFMGMKATAWTWLILGIAAIAIIAVVWYYSMQTTSEKNNSRRD